MSDLVLNCAEAILLAQVPGDTPLLALLHFFIMMCSITTTASAPFRTSYLSNALFPSASLQTVYFP